MMKHRMPDVLHGTALDVPNSGAGKGMGRPANIRSAPGSRYSLPPGNSARSGTCCSQHGPAVRSGSWHSDGAWVVVAPEYCATAASAHHPFKTEGFIRSANQFLVPPEACHSPAKSRRAPAMAMTTKMSQTIMAPNPKIARPNISPT